MKVAWLALGLLVAVPAVADDAPVDVRTRETALAATIDMEFQDAMVGGVSGAVILEQDGKVTLRAGYGFADLKKTTPFTTDALVPTGIMAPMNIGAAWTSSVEDIYRWFNSERFAKDGSKQPLGDWEMRKDTNGHLVQISHNRMNGTFLSYFCWRPDDRVFLYLIATGGEKADRALLNRVMTSVRDAGMMPVTNFH